MTEREINLAEYIEYTQQKYEARFNEPWSALEARVRERHPEYFEMRVELVDDAPWWRSWR